MQSASDIFLGWSRGPLGRDFYIRQLRDMKVAPAVESMTLQAMRVYAKVCGLTLARAHDKAGYAAMIAGYLGSVDHFDEAIGDYAIDYADQVERDYETFVKAVRSGQLKSDLVQVGWQPHSDKSSAEASCCDIYDSKFDFVRLYFWWLACRYSLTVSSSRALFHE
jgi:hypothetical protein